MELHEARHWQAVSENKVRCNLCRFHCVIADGKRGRCGVRENQGGTLYTLVYGKTISENVDPIEKKPLYHFHPGSRSLSIATVGCNLHCLHCQNHQISQWPRERSDIPGSVMTPEDVVQHALKSQSVSISYTYTEPTIFYEYAFDTAVIARHEGVKNVFVSNGYTSTRALEEIAPYLDAANIDLKGFSDERYRQVTGASLQGVLDCLKDYRRLGIWLEVTTLVIPGHNDSDAELQQIAGFIAEELGQEVPWHISAFYPTYKMQDRPPTPIATLYKARNHGRAAGLHYVYLGNVNEPGASDTLCPACGKTVISRHRLYFEKSNVSSSRCPKCDHVIPGVGLD